MRGSLRDKQMSTLGKLEMSKLFMTLHQSSMSKPYIGQKSRFLLTPPAFDALVSRIAVGIAFGIEKLEWCGYPIVKKV